MPFTLSHPAAVLPFVRTPLLPAGLVIGSMVPDLPYFVPLGIPRDLTHSPEGVLSADLPMAVVAFLLWIFFFRAPVIDFAPRWLRSRYPASILHRDWSGPSVVKTVAMLIVSILVGVLTHLVWDAFTHPDGWVVLQIPELQRYLGPFALYRWAQYFSSLAGAVIVAIAVRRWVRSTPARLDPDRSARAPQAVRVALWVAVAGSTLVLGSAIWVAGLIDGLEPFDRALLFRSVTIAMTVGGIIAVLACVAWFVFPRKTSTIVEELPE